MEGQSIYLFTSKHVHYKVQNKNWYNYIKSVILSNLEHNVKVTYFIINDVTTVEKTRRCKIEKVRVRVENLIIHNSQFILQWEMLNTVFIC